MNSSTSNLEATEASPRRRKGSEELRDRLIEAGLAEFAENGFEGSSTRAIAARAGAHQPQINYHFDSKEELWRACVDRLMADLDALIADVDRSSPGEAMADVIRGLVRLAADRPELNRIMIQEGTSPSERLDWIVDTHVRARHELLIDLWNDAVASGEAVPVNPIFVHYLIVGAASLIYANAPEARLLLGLDPHDPDLVEEHAETLVRLLLPSPTNP